MQITKTYENDEINRYLCIRLKEEQRVNTYQLRVVENIKPDFILPMTLREEGREQKLYYQINSRYNLARAIEENGNLSKAQFISLIKDILGIFLAEKQQQLKPEYFVIHHEYIYFKRNSGFQNPEVVYLPADNTNEDLLSQIRTLIRYLIPLKVNYPEAEMFYRKVLQVVDGNTFTLNELNDILTQAEPVPLQEEKIRIIKNWASENQSSFSEKPSEGSDIKKNDPANKVEPKEKVGAQTGKKATSEDTAKNQFSIASDNRTIIIALIQVFFVLISIVAAISLEITEPKMIFGFILLVVALDFLVVYLVRKKIPVLEGVNQGGEDDNGSKPAVKRVAQETKEDEEERGKIRQKKGTRQNC